MFGLTHARPRDLVVTVLLTCISVSVVSKATALDLTPLRARDLAVRAESLRYCPDWKSAAGSKGSLFVDGLLVNAPSDLAETREEAIEMTIVPTPQRMKTGAAWARLTSKPVIAIAADADETVRYGAGMLQRDLKTYFGLDVAIDDSGTAESAGATVLLGVAGQFPAAENALSQKARSGLTAIQDAESCVIEVTCAADGTNTPRAVILGRDAVGAMYGCFTLSQAFSRSEGKVSLPASLYIEDWPVMKTRAQVDSPADASPVSIEHFDLLARWRINTIYYQHFYPFMQKHDAAGNSHPVKWTHQADPGLPEVLREAHRRGITVYGAIGARWAPYDFYLGEHLTFRNPEHLKVVLSVFEQLAEAGVDGLLLLFDDITEDLKPYELGREHAQWMRRVKETAERHGIGDRVMMCPTHYWKGWNPEYFRPFLEAGDLRDLRMHFCPFDPESIRRAEAAGLTNYEWWQNGVYGLGTGEWVQGPMRVISGGIARVERCWYGGNTEKVLADLRSLPERTLAGWLCTGGEVPLAVWSYYLWNPAGYETAKMEHDIAEVTLGRGTSRYYAE